LGLASGFIPTDGIRDVNAPKPGYQIEESCDS